MTIFRYALKKNTGNKINLVLVCLLPFPLLIIRASPQSLPVSINLYGMLIFYSSFLLSRPFVEDRMKGHIVRIAASPVSNMRYLGSHLAAYFILQGLQIFLFLTGSYFVYGLEPGLYPGLAILYLSFAVMSTAFSLAWNSMFRTFNLSFGLFSGACAMLCLVSEISLPLALIPQQIRNYAMFLPTYWLPYGIEVMYKGKGSGLILAHAVLLAYAAVFFLAGTKRRLR